MLVNCSLNLLACSLQGPRMASASPWFFILLAVGVLDGLIQLSDYLRWRKERRESERTSD